MSQRKLIVSLSIAVLLAMTAGVSQGSVSRMEGMGLDVSLLSQFTDDYANIFWYPTSVVRQNNLVLAELGNNGDNGGEVDEVDTADQTYTVIRNFPRLGAIAFQMAQTQNDVFTGSGNLNNEQLDVIWGNAFSSFDFAVRFDMTQSTFEFEDDTPATVETSGLSALFNPFNPYPFGTFFPDAITDTGLEVNTWGITPAVAIHFGEDDRLELAGTYRRFTFERTDGPTPTETFEDAGNPSYALLARAILHRGGTHTWFPAAWYVNDDLSYEVTGVLPGTVEVDETYRNMGIGISDNMRVNDNNLLLWGITFARAQREFERNDTNVGGAPTDFAVAENSLTAMPLVFAAIETDATRWLKLRIGASRGRFVAKDETTDFGAPSLTEETRTVFSDFNLGLGLGLRWSNLDIDMTLNEQFPLSGGWILSGNSETPFNRVSATYHF